MVSKYLSPLQSTHSYHILHGFGLFGEVGNVTSGQAIDSHCAYGGVGWYVAHA